MSMRAVRVSAYGGPEVLKLENIPKPTPKEGEVLVRVHSCGINPTDIYTRSGLRSIGRDPPFVTAKDGAGVVEEVGQGVIEFKKGDRVYLVCEPSGTCAEYTTASVRHVALLSDKLSFAQGAAIGIPYYTAYKALYTLAHARPGETVLVHGASGAVGTAAVQIAVANGQRVFGTAGTEEGLQLVKKLGADQVFNHRDEGYTDKILAATGGKGVDVILEMLANVNLDTDLDIVAIRGRVVVVGSRGNIEISPRKARFKEATVVGIMLTILPHESEWTEIKAGIQAGQKVGWLVPVVAKEYRLEDVAQAHIDILSNSGTLGKLVVVGSRGYIEISPRKSMFKEATVVGIMLTILPHESEWTEIKAGIQAGQKVGWLVPVVAKEYRLEDVAQAHIDILSNSGTLGKLAVNVAGN